MKTLLLALLLGATVSASAQTTNAPAQVTPSSTAPATSAAKIGPAPANSPQKQILNSALSPETRSTLQQAMNATPPPAPAQPASK